MGVTVRVEPIEQDIVAITSELLSPQARSAALADFAREKLVEGEQKNQAILGRIPPHKTFVDGSEGTEDRVRPEGTIVYEFEILSDIFTFIVDQLKQHAPVGGGKDPHPGLYKSSFEFFADWTQVDVGGVIPHDADEYIFLSTVAYSKKIEGGQSSQAPDGVFQVVALLARARYGNQARIEFTYRSPEGRVLLQGRAGNRSDARTPAISIKLR